MEPQLQGVVIITLPPPDNPSKGKTITAFTLSEPETPRPSPQPQLQDDLNLWTRSPPPPSPSASYPHSSFSLKKPLIWLLGASFLFFFLWASFFSEVPIEFLRSSEEGERRRETSSFLFPLYHKFVRNRVLREQVEFEHGVLAVGDGRGEETKEVKISKAVSSSAVNSSVVFPVRGNIFPDGLYYTSVLVGNPPRPYYLDVDTGSDLTWIQCDAPCTSCAKGPHPLYKPTKGKIVPSRDSLCLDMQSNQNYGHCESCQQCDYEIAYADHSSSMGVLARDGLWLTVENSDPVKSTFVFGCAYDQQGHLLASPANTDGIIGLGSAKVSLPSQLANQDMITNIVGHCISGEAEGAGYMFLGDDFVPRWGMTWVPMVSTSTNFYQSEVLAIKYGDRLLSSSDKSSNPGQVIFDTGSSYTYLTNAAYSNLIDSLKGVSLGLVRDVTDPTLPVCWQPNFIVRFVKDVQQFFEPLTLQFERKWGIMSRVLIVPPEGYLMISEKGNVCLGVLDGSGVHGGTTNILGDISLRGQLVVYDNVRKQIGWVQSDCAEPRSATNFPFFF